MQPPRFLVQRRHVDLGRIASAICRRFRARLPRIPSAACLLYIPYTAAPPPAGPQPLRSVHCRTPPDQAGLPVAGPARRPPGRFPPP
ncbi:putative leader peptide [Streptomyces sclerotialus]|uniref:putative leader peptide n=1 Tax=Streptomyces sclerotialus TaxID=1957 RepID=UPI0034A48075